MPAGGVDPPVVARDITARAADEAAAAGRHVRGEAGCGAARTAAALKRASDGSAAAVRSSTVSLGSAVAAAMSSSRLTTTSSSSSASTSRTRPNAGPSRPDRARHAASRAWARRRMRRSLPDPALGVFETLLVLDGRPLELEPHLARLERSLAALYGDGLPPELRPLAREHARGVALGRLRLTVAPGPDGRRGADAIVVASRPRRHVPALGGGAAARADRSPGGLGAHKWADRRLLAERRPPAAAAVPAAPRRRRRVLEASRAQRLRRRGRRRRDAAGGRPRAARGSPAARARALGCPCTRSASARRAARRRRGVRHRLGPRGRAGLRCAAEWSAGPVTPRARCTGSDGGRTAAPPAHGRAPRRHDETRRTAPLSSSS